MRLGFGVFGEVHFPIRALSEHLFEIVVTPYIFLNYYRGNGLSPLMELTFIVRSKCNHAIFSGECKMGHTFSQRVIESSFVSGANRESAWDSGPSKTANIGGHHNMKIGKTDVKYPFGPHLLQIIKKIKHFTRQCKVYLMPL